MPTVSFFAEGVACAPETGTNLRLAAIQAGVQLYRSWHRLANCRGQGKCGSCRVEISDPAAVSPAERTAAEHCHLDRAFSDRTTRLACQVAVIADVKVLTQKRGGRVIDGRSFIPRGF